MSDEMAAIRRSKTRHKTHEWPEPVREAAMGMVSSVNKFTVTVGFDLDALRIAMGIELEK